MGTSTKYVIIQLIKIALVILLIFALFWIGAMIGYGVIGEGKLTDVFNGETWTHITDFFK